jgi:hypothetical protein
MHGLPVDLVGYHQRVPAEARDTFVDTFEQVLQHDFVCRGP